MAFQYYFNMEPLAIRIAEKHILNMSNDNFIEGDDVFLDESKLMNNLENGFVALTQLNCYLESFLNTIIDSCMKCEDGKLLRSTIDEKIKIIYEGYKKQNGKLKTSDCWKTYKVASRVRNEMIHFKKTFIGWGGGVPNFKIGNQEAAFYFTRRNMEQVFQKYTILCKLIAEEVGLEIFHDMKVFICDGVSPLVNYVYDPKTTETWAIDYLKELKEEGII